MLVRMVKGDLGQFHVGDGAFTHQPAAGLPAGHVCLTAASGSSPPPA